MTHKQRVLNLLSDGRPHTHHELYRLGCVAHSRVSDLRKDGYQIEQWRDGDTYQYQLVSRPLEEPDTHGRNPGFAPSGPSGSSSGSGTTTGPHLPVRGSIPQCAEPSVEPLQLALHDVGRGAYTEETA